MKTITDSTESEKSRYENLLNYSMLTVMENSYDPDNLILDDRYIMTPSKKERIEEKE